MKNKKILSILMALIIFLQSSAGSIHSQSVGSKSKVLQMPFAGKMRNTIQSKKIASNVAKMLQSNEVGYLYEINESWGRYVLRFNGLLSNASGYIAEVYEYYTGRTCTINSNSVTLVTDDEFYPLVNFSVTFTDPDYYSPYPEVLSFNTPGNVTLSPWPF